MPKFLQKILMFFKKQKKNIYTDLSGQINVLFTTEYGISGMQFPLSFHLIFVLHKKIYLFLLLTKERTNTSDCLP